MSEKEFQVSVDWKQGSKRLFVMANAIELLIAVGYQGLSMRGVAEKCGMSLSNVQYYFRTKEDLILAIAERYFDDCEADLTHHLSTHGPVSDRDSLRSLLALLLDHGQAMTDMCRVFRELWAIGSRNDTIAGYLNKYYQRLAARLMEALSAIAPAEDQLKRTALSILVFSEGYSIVGFAGVIDHEDAIEMFTDMLLMPRLE